MATILAVILILTAIDHTLLYLDDNSGRLDIVLVAIWGILFLVLISSVPYLLFDTSISRSTLFLAAALVGLLDRTHIKILARLLVGVFLRTLLFFGIFTGRSDLVLMATVAGIFFSVLLYVVFLLRNALVTQPTDDNNNEEDGGDEEGPVSRDDHNMEISTPASAEHVVAIDDQGIEDHEVVGGDVDDHDQPVIDDQVDMPSIASYHEVGDDQDHHDQPTRDDRADMPTTTSDHEVVDDDQDHDDPPTRDDHDMQSTGTASDHREVDDDQDVDLASPAESTQDTISPELISLPSTFQPR